MSQSLARLLLHIIFATKNREPYFTDLTIRRDVNAYLAATANHLGCPSLSVGGVADHVHVVCGLNRTLSVATLVAKLKVSSNQVLKGKFLSQFAWQNGYAAFSVAESTLESVIEYVTKQDEHHQRLTFQEEYRACEFRRTLCLGLIDIGRHSSAPTGLAVVGVKPTQAEAWAKFPRPFGPQRT
jgi:putative transposase